MALIVVTTELHGTLVYESKENPETAAINAAGSEILAMLTMKQADPEPDALECYKRWCAYFDEEVKPFTRESISPGYRSSRHWINTFMLKRFKAVPRTAFYIHV